jgi:hypothetical protein
MAGRFSLDLTLPPLATLVFVPQAASARSPSPFLP